MGEAHPSMSLYGAAKVFEAAMGHLTSKPPGGDDAPAQILPAQVPGEPFLRVRP